MIPRLLALAFLSAAAWAPLQAAKPATAAPDAEMLAMEKLVNGLKYRQGEITLRGGLAKIHVPAEFRYLDGPDAETVLSKIWGNPPDEPPLGMLFPAQIGPLDAESWGIIITYEEDGYVKDDDASKIKYDDLLKDMKKDVAEGSKQREKAGYGSIELLGWAAPPRYDTTAKKLYWAKELRFNGNTEHTLNYNIRMLGRRGVLVLNAVASMPQLPAIEQSTPAILQMVDFQEGHRYADFNPSTDKVATYGLAALVAGGVLAKAGFFKVAIAALLAGKKFVIVGAIALFAVIKKFFGAKSGTADS